jgi:hypothetical protein
MKMKKLSAFLNEVKRAKKIDFDLGEVVYFEDDIEVDKIKIENNTELEVVDKAEGQFAFRILDKDHKLYKKLKTKPIYLSAGEVAAYGPHLV